MHCGACHGKTVSKEAVWKHAIPQTHWMSGNTSCTIRLAFAQTHPTRHSNCSGCCTTQAVSTNNTFNMLECCQHATGSPYFQVSDRHLNHADKQCHEAASESVKIEIVVEPRIRTRLPIERSSPRRCVPVARPTSSDALCCVPCSHQCTINNTPSTLR